MSKRICIISFSQIHRDGRVLRQIEFLEPHYDITAIGYGPPHPAHPQVHWLRVDQPGSLLAKVGRADLIPLGRLASRLYETWYWQKPYFKQALELALSSKADAYHANDLFALPVAAEAVRRTGAKLVFDAHEYSPLEYANRPYWPIYKPLVEYFLRRYVPQTDAFTTASPGFADAYKQEFGWDPLVILNAPKAVPVTPKEVDPQNIGLVYHGGANKDRQLELMVQTMPHTERRFHLHFILVGAMTDYVRQLHSMAAKLAPDRISFHEPVDPSALVQRTTEYDIGFYLLTPINYNHEVTLPNKLFEFLAAGLGVFIGPSPGMAALVEQYGVGWVAPTFKPVEVAAMLNRLTAELIMAKKRAALQTAPLFTAETEMGKLVGIYRRLLG